MAKWAKIGPEIRFFHHFLKFASLVFLQIVQNDSLEQFLTSRGTLTKKLFGSPKLVPKLGFCHFLKFVSLVFLDIAQDCSFGQCLTSSRVETSKNNVWPILAPSRPKSIANEVFQHFLSYFIKREKILLNRYFISVDYIEFHSPITPLLPFLGIE